MALVTTIRLLELAIDNPDDLQKHAIRISNMGEAYLARLPTADELVSTIVGMPLKSTTCMFKLLCLFLKHLKLKINKFRPGEAVLLWSSAVGIAPLKPKCQRR